MRPVEHGGDVVVDGAHEVPVEGAFVLRAPRVGVLLVPLPVVLLRQPVELLRVVRVIRVVLTGGISGAAPPGTAGVLVALGQG